MSKKPFLSVLLIALMVFGGLPLAENLQLKEWNAYAGASEDDWSMMGHDPANSGYSTSTVPETPFRIWTFPNDNKTYEPIRSSPVVSEGFLYTSTAVCLDASTGRLIWSNPEFGSYYSPAVSDGVVYLGFYGLLVALNASTGTEIWRTNLINVYGNIESPSGAPTVTGGVVYQQGEGFLYALKASTGIQLWKYPNAISAMAPAVVDGYVFGGTITRYWRPFRSYIYALNASNGKEVWRYHVRTAPSSPAVYDGKVFVGVLGDGVYALNARTGELVWNHTTDVDYVISPAVAYGMVYIGSEDGNIYALDAATGDSVWNFTTEGEVHSSAAVANGVVYASSNDRYLYAINASIGTLIWKFLTISAPQLVSHNTDMVASPVVANGKIYIGTDEGKFRAFGKMPEMPETSTLPLVVASVAVVVLVGASLIVTFKKRKRAS